MKSVNQPYKNGLCRTCANCTASITCKAHLAKGNPLPCPAIHACNKMREKAGSGVLGKITDKISSSKLLGNDQKKKLSRAAERAFRKL